jgi:hypothetical protein
VDRELFALAQKFYEFWNQFLRILVRAVDIITSNNYDRKTETMVIRAGDEFGSGLRRGVGIRRIQKRFLATSGMVTIDLSVDLVRRKMEEFCEPAILFRRLEQGMCTNHIICRILKGIIEGIVDVALRGKMNNRTYLIFVKQM